VPNCGTTGRGGHVCRDSNCAWQHAADASRCQIGTCSGVVPLWRAVSPLSYSTGREVVGCCARRGVCSVDLN